jgi:hypothetical protein
MATSPSTVRLTNVRLTFPQLFDAKQVNGQGDPKFSAAFLFARNHAAVAELQKAIMTAATGKWGAKATEILAQLKAANKICVQDGDGKSQYDGYAGNLFLNASSKVKPLIVDRTGRNVLTAADGKPYSGCYVEAIVDVWAQDNKFGKRINASLMGVRFLTDGERLAGGATATMDDFEPLPDEAGEKAEVQGAASLF